jgi:hypothetical protein
VASDFDESDFVDTEFQASRKSPFSASGAAPAGRPPSREELENKVGETQHRIQELKRLQENLERERASLEEARRRRTEFHVGRDEMVQHLTRGIGLLEEAEFAARRDAEQMAKTLGELRDSLVKVQSLNDQVWTQENYNAELTRALTTIENSRLEWNAALLKWSVLNARPSDKPADGVTNDERPDAASLASLSMMQLTRMGLALTWPLVVVGLAAVTTLVIVLVRR